MLFPDELFAYVQIELSESLARFPMTTPRPLSCDRYIARSVMQKTIRRGEVELAQRSLANLYEHSPRDVWRHIVIICVEDIGVANVDLLAKIIAAKRDRKRRDHMGGDWHVLAGLVRLMAESIHCQAACDLLLKVTNDPSMESTKADALDAEPNVLTSQISDPNHPIEERAIAAMALGGCLADGQQHKFPNCVFEILTELGHFSHVVASCHAAWKISRNPMAMLLPLAWQAWMQCDIHHNGDDELPTVQTIGDVPSYGLDQFTRIGNQISRGYLKDDVKLRSLFKQAGITEGAYGRTLGDILFLIEGGLVANRMIWSEAERLRQPHRWLPAVATLGHHLPAIIRHCQFKASQIATARGRLYHL